MGRRRKTVAAFSLFAFQDIITSVSGIIIVMMLLLSLELVERNAAAPPPSMETLKQLQEAIAQAESELVKLKATAGTQDTMIAQLAQTSAPELQDELRELERRMTETRNAIEQFESIRAKLEAEQQAVAVDKFDSQKQVDELEQLTERAKQLQGTIETEQQENRLLFSVPAGFRENGFLVVVQRSGISVGPFAQAAAPLTFASSRGLLGDSAVDSFVDWLKPRKTSSLYLLVVVRPDGISLFEDLEQELNVRQVRYGYDVVGQNEVVLSPVKGAVP